MDESLFKKGTCFKDYGKSSDFQKAYRNASIATEDELFFSSYTVNVLCISEKWCKDCRREVPLFAYIADRAGWDLRIFGMDDIPGLMEEYATDGKKVIPVFVLFDENFKELGRFIEQAPAGKTTCDVLKEIMGG